MSKFSILCFDFNQECTDSMCAHSKPDGVALPGLFGEANAFKGASQRASLQKKERKSQSTFYSLSTEVQVGWSVVFSTLAIFGQCY